MRKKVISMIVNIALLVSIVSSGFLLMGTYDVNCADPNIKYADFNYVDSYPGFDVINNIITGHNEININQGIPTSIPISVMMTMEPTQTLNNVYGSNYNGAYFSISDGGGLSGVTVGPTTRTDASSTGDVPGATYYFNTTLEIPSNTIAASYTVGICFYITNNFNNGNIFQIQKQVYIHINPYLEIETTSLPLAAVGHSYNATIDTTGGTEPFTWSASQLPDGLSIDPVLGTISGTPTTAGTYSVDVEVSDFSYPTLTTNSSISLIVAEPLDISTDSLPDGTVSKNYNTTLSANGGSGLCTWSAIGLPTGLSLDSTTGVISGIPTTTGAFTIDVTAADSMIPNHSTQSSIVLQINVDPLALAGSLPVGEIATSYTANLSADGGIMPYTWNVTGLPDGLSLNSSTGIISGTPTTFGAFALDVTVSDSQTPIITTQGGMALIINKPLSIITNTLATGQTGLAYHATLSASEGVPPYSWSATGLPTGLSLNSNTGVISGTTNSFGTYDITFTVTGGNSATLSKTIQLIINNVVPTTSNNNSSTSVSSENYAMVSDSNGNVVYNTIVNHNTNSGTATVNIKDLSILNETYNKTKVNDKGVKTVEIAIPQITGVKEYIPTIPAEFWTNGDGSKAIEIKTGIATVIMPDYMLSSIDLTNAKNVSLSISSVDKTMLDAESRALVGDKPIIDLSLYIDDNKIAWKNDSAAVEVSIPYKPSEEELKDPEHITIWYLDETGKVVAVPSGKYDPVSGLVTFSVNHFSKYVIAYVKRTFSDINSVNWANKQIEILASKGIISGTPDSKYNPSSSITRADFMVLLIKTLGINGSVKDNFSDINTDAYYYGAVGLAKKLGITTGSGSNKFNPNSYITRQDMLVMTEKALKILKLTDSKSSNEILNKYTDKEQIAVYAKDSVAFAINKGLIEGKAGKINPLSNTSRAEAAVILYHIYNML